LGPLARESPCICCLTENLAFFLKQTTSSQPLKAHNRSQDSAVSKVTRLLAGQFRFVCWQVQETALLQNALTSTEADSVPYSMGTRVLFQPGHNVGPHLHIAPRLRMTRAIPLLPLYDITVWSRTTLPLKAYDIHCRICTCIDICDLLLLLLL